MSGSLGVGGDEAGQVVSALNAAVKEAALDEQPAVVDLRGRFAAPGQPGITVPSQFLLNGIPEPGIASQQAALQSARLVVVKPSVLVRDSGD